MVRSGEYTKEKVREEEKNKVCSKEERISSPQVLKRKAEQGRGNAETSSEDYLQMTEGINQAEGNKGEEETSEAETDDQK